MDMFDEVKNSLRHCYRVDRYSIADIDTNEIERLAEYFIVTGDNSCIRVIDYDTGLVKISVFGNDYFCSTDYEPAEFLDALHDTIMIYDYCLTDLRKLPIKEAVKSNWFAYKKCVDKMLSSGQMFNLDFPLEKKRELQQRCNYLAHAYELEWNGVISLDTCKKFSTITDLDEYVEKNNLKLAENKESDDKRINALVRNRISTDEDPLEYIRDIDDTLYRYRISKTPNLKELKALELADAKYMKEYVKVLKMDQQIQKVYQKIPFSKTKEQLQKLVNTSEKLEKKIEEQSAHVMFLKD